MSENINCNVTTCNAIVILYFQDSTAKGKEKGKSPSLQSFEDPEGRIELPASLKVHEWKRPIVRIQEYLTYDYVRLSNRLFRESGREFETSPDRIESLSNKFYFGSYKLYLLCLCLTSNWQWNISVYFDMGHGRKLYWILCLFQDFLEGKTPIMVDDNESDFDLLRPNEHLCHSEVSFLKSLSTLDIKSQ